MLTAREKQEALIVAIHLPIDSFLAPPSARFSVQRATASSIRGQINLWGRTGQFQ